MDITKLKSSTSNKKTVKDTHTQKMEDKEEVKPCKSSKSKKKQEVESESKEEEVKSIINKNDIVKFQNLELDQNYKVQNYTELIENKYPYRILEVSEDGSEETFELFTTPLLLKYIEIEEPNKFSFTVRKKGINKYPFIEGYSQEREWVLSE